jgi:hypothetical protein
MTGVDLPTAGAAIRAWIAIAVLLLALRFLLYSGER